jgi:hypothetical protein
MVVYSIQFEDEGASVTHAITSSIENKLILFLTYIRHSYAGRKFRQSYRGLFFHDIVCATYGVPCFVEQMDDEPLC